MINTVLGIIQPERLGVTLMHEHITWDWGGAESTKQYSIDEVVDTMLPYLVDLKNSGCATLVEATTLGAGRDVHVLIECAKRSGLNILTNVGVWDGGDTPQKYTPTVLREMEIDEIVEIWSAEYFFGIGGTEVKPAFIKLAIGDTGKITSFQEKVLRAAARTSLKTQLPIQCHTFLANSAIQAVKIVEEENLPLNKFIWVHADGERKMDVVKELAQKGVWVEFDCLARTEDLSWHVEAVREMCEEGLIEQLLISQDAGVFYFGQENNDSTILPYSRIFKEFISMCEEQGVSWGVFDVVLRENVLRVLV